MYTLFFGILDCLRERVKIRKLHFYDETFSDLTVEVCGQEYVVSIRKEEKKDA